MRRKLCFAIFVMAIFVQCTANDGDPEREENSLIPRKIIPLEYTLSFEIDMADEGTLFSGTTTIKVQCAQPTKEIILNVKNLEIGNVEVTKEVRRRSRSCLTNNRLFECLFPTNESPTEIKTLEILNQDADTAKEWHIIFLKDQLQENEVVTVQIEYKKLTSILDDLDKAFIRYSYKNSEGVEKWIAVTRSEAANARRLYPCVDERDLRAPVTVIISHYRELISLSNTYIQMGDVSDSTKLTDFVVEKYIATKPLPTFSIGLFVGDFTSRDLFVNPASENVRIWADETTVDHMEYARKTAQRIFPFYQTYFENIHSVRKVEIIALPNYGYTDKWMLALITLDESSIITTPEGNKSRRIEVALRLCHAFSQQFFGPQTTNTKWSENWLNVGLALFFRAPCFDHIFPEEKQSLVIIDQTESFIRISDADPRRVFHPLTLSDSQINLTTLFEDPVLADIAYYLVRMVNSIVGQTEDVLYDSIKKYIADSRAKVFNLTEIWDLFTRVGFSYYMPQPLTLERVMDSWTSKNGIPIVKLTRNDGRGAVKVTQELSETDSDGNPIYKFVPLIYSTKRDLQETLNYERRVRIWLKDEEDEITFVRTDEWVIHDSRLDVLCRYVYDESLLNLIEETLMSPNEYKVIPDLARTQLISDIFAIAEMNKYTHYSYSTVFRIMEYLDHETSLPVLMVALHEFDKIRLRLFESNVFHLFQEYVQHILQSIIHREGYSYADALPLHRFYDEYYLKKLVVTSACTFHHQICVTQSRQLLNMWRGAKTDHDNLIPEVLQKPIYCEAIREGGEREWQFLWTLYVKRIPENSDHILNALACSKNPKQLRDYLDWSLDSDKMALKDSLTVFQSLATNENGYFHMFEFLSDNYDQILTIHADNLSNVYFYWKLLYEITWTRTDFNQTKEIWCCDTCRVSNLEELHSNLNRTLLKVRSSAKCFKLEEFTNSIEYLLTNAETHLKESKEKALRNILWSEKNEETITSFFQAWKTQKEKEALE